MAQLKSFVSKKIQIRQSNNHGEGMFALEPIKKDEIVFIKGGHILTRAEIFTSSVINSYHPISDDHFIAAATPEEEYDIKLKENHSCEPNCGLRGEITFVAMRDIATGEELTIDYAMLDNEDYRFDCTCGVPNCRKVVTGFDWKIRSLQQKYGNYFALYLLEKIRAQNS